MSEFRTVEIDIKEEDVLVQALKQMGYNPVTHQQEIDLKTYYSDRVKPKAHIVVGKDQFNGYADAGFQRTSKGFNMHIDEMDQRKFKIGKLKQSYAEAKIMKTIKGTAKFTLRARQEEQGKVKLVLRRNF